MGGAEVLYTVLGALGAGLIIVTYLLLQLEKIDPKSRTYSSVNAIGAALILVSLYNDWNLGAAIVEGFWLLVSLFGLYIHGRDRRHAPERVNMNANVTQREDST